MARVVHWPLLVFLFFCRTDSFLVERHGPIQGRMEAVLVELEKFAKSLKICAYGTQDVGRPHVSNKFESFLLHGQGMGRMILASVLTWATSSPG